MRGLTTDNHKNIPGFRGYARNDSSANTCSLRDICGYSLGEGANSLVMNSIATFAMLYYTQALGLSPVYAGIAMSIAVFWDAVSDPIMGFITDHTHTRYGRRHPYILVGGLCMAGLLYAVWAVPGFVQTSEIRIFSYLIAMNILLRTALTVFFVPYCALGFEMTTDYEGRSRIQGTRQVFNMAANFLGPALAWALFFPETAEGKNATDNPENYLQMGASFALAIVALTLLTLLFTYRYRGSAAASDMLKPPRPGFKAFINTNKDIVLDEHARWVYVFAFLAVLNMVIVSSLLPFFYVYFMKIGGGQVSVAQFAAVIGSAAGGLLATRMPRWFEKKGSILIACGLSIFGNLIVAIFFMPGWVAPDQTPGFVFFVIMNGIYWMGSGIMIPTAVSMIADIAEINEHKTGDLKDGSYSAVYSFVFKSAISFALLVSGLMLSLIGFDSGAEQHSEQVIRNLGATMLLAGPIVCLFAAFTVTRYNVSRVFLDNLRKANA